MTVGLDLDADSTRWQPIQADLPSRIRNTVATVRKEGDSCTVHGSATRPVHRNEQHGSSRQDEIGPHPRIQRQIHAVVCNNCP
tara:strand:- start:174 stop:422 length:249 start_codon:yes stop_codon:yes gene_type:complete